MSLSIVVETTDPSGARREYAFSRSPVRIGRNALNEVVLDHPFVSQWHGAIQFGPDGVSFVDLGSTNGSSIRGRRLPKNAPTRLALDGATPVMIGTIAVDVRPARAGDAERHSLLTSGASFDSAMVGRRATMAPTSAAAQSATQVLGSPGTTALQDALSAVERTRPAYQAYRAAWSQVLLQVRARLEPLPPAMRAPTLRLILRDLPQIAREPELLALLSELGIEPEAANVFDAEAWLKRLVPLLDTGAGGQVNVPVAMERVGAAIETLAQAFVELRKGKAAFCGEIGLSSGADTSDLARRDSGRGVVAYLLDWNADGIERLEELRRAFADIAMHQVAVVAGVAEGGRELLASVSPDAHGKALARASWIARFVPGAKLRELRRRHSALVGEDGFTRVLFGGAFARAYWTVYGRTGGS